MSVGALFSPATAAAFCLAFSGESDIDAQCGMKKIYNTIQGGNGSEKKKNAQSGSKMKREKNADHGCISSFGCELAG